MPGAGPLCGEARHGPGMVGRFRRRKTQRTLAANPAVDGQTGGQNPGRRRVPSGAPRHSGKERLSAVRIAAFFGVFIAAALCPAQPVPLKDRVLVLVNDRMPREAGTGNEGASVFVGRYYAARRNIPAANIFHLKTAITEETSMEDYKAQIETPLRKFLDANGGVMRRKILYIVPTYGVPVRISDKLAVDSVLVMMYGHEDLQPPLKNPYAAAVGSRPPHFDVLSDRAEAVSG